MFFYKIIKINYKTISISLFTKFTSLSGSLKVN